MGLALEVLLAHHFGPAEPVVGLRFAPDEGLENDLEALEAHPSLADELRKAVSSDSPDE